VKENAKLEGIFPPTMKRYFSIAFMAQPLPYAAPMLILVMSQIHWQSVLLIFTGAILLSLLIVFFITYRERKRIVHAEEERVHLQEMVEHRTSEIRHQKELLETQTKEIQSANTELRYTNAELERTNAALKDANAFKTRMVSIVSHDLKNPLGSMLGLAKVLENEVQVNEHREMAHDMGNLAAQMLLLVKDLLDSAAMETGKMDIQKTLVDVSELVSAVVWQSRPIAAKKEQQLIVAIKPQCCLEGDQRRLWQVFENLVSNAVKYSPIGKNIWITLEHSTNAHSTSTGVADTSLVQNIRFSVRDEGPGLTEEDKQKAFGHFQKLSAKPTAGESSSGVGLAIVRQIAELHGGRVSIESVLGSGATFIVEFPIEFPKDLPVVVVE
jgi:signal transduction histidine kinase